VPCGVISQHSSSLWQCAAQGVTQRLAHDGFAKSHEHHRLMVTAISKEVGVVVKTHTDRDAAWYNEVGSPVTALHVVLVVNPAS